MENSVPGLLVLGDVSDYFLVPMYILLGLVVVVGGIFVLNFGRIWIQAYSSGCPTAIKTFIGMWLRKVNSRTIGEPIKIRPHVENE